MFDPLTHRQGQYTYTPFLSEFRLIKRCTCTYIMTWYTCGTPAVHLRLRYYPYNFLLALLSPASDSLSSLDSKLRHSAYAHLRVARAQCVYGLFSLGFVGVWWWWWVWHLPLSYHPPVIFTLHLKFIFHIKLVGPVDVRSLNTVRGDMPHALPI